MKYFFISTLLALFAILFAIFIYGPIKFSILGFKPKRHILKATFEVSSPGREFVFKLKGTDLFLVRKINEEEYTIELNNDNIFISNDIVKIDELLNFIFGIDEFSKIRYFPLILRNGENNR